MLWYVVVFYYCNVYVYIYKYFIGFTPLQQIMSGDMEAMSQISHALTLWSTKNPKERRHEGQGQGCYLGIPGMGESYVHMYILYISI